MLQRNFMSDVADLLTDNPRASLASQNFLGTSPIISGKEDSKEFSVFGVEAPENISGYFPGCIHDYSFLDMPLLCFKKKNITSSKDDMKTALEFLDA